MKTLIEELSRIELSEKLSKINESTDKDIQAQLDAEELKQAKEATKQAKIQTKIMQAQLDNELEGGRNNISDFIHADEEPFEEEPFEDEFVEEPAPEEPFEEPGPDEPFEEPDEDKQPVEEE